MRAHLQPLLAFAMCAAMCVPASAQDKPAPPAKPAAQRQPPSPGGPSPIRLRGVVTFGGNVFQAQESFDTILGSRVGPTYGGGIQVLLPRNLYAEVAVWRFSGTGERVFIGPGDEVFPLGIPVEIDVTPIEITGGWRYFHCPRTLRARPCPLPRFVPYAGAGYSSYKYSERSDFALPDDNVDERFNGFHVVGGAEYRVTRWIVLGGEVAWASVPDAFGAGGVAAAFGEDNLGGTTFRAKIAIGR